MGFVTKTRTRKKNIEKLDNNTMSIDSNVNKGTVLFSADVVSRLGLRDAKVALYIADQVEDPNYGKAFIALVPEYGRAVIEGKMVNSMFFIESLQDFFSISDASAAFTVSETPTVNDYITEESFDMYELLYEVQDITSTEE